MTDDTECGFCPKGVRALWHVHGYAEDGSDGNFVYTPACDEHKWEFDYWDGDTPFYFHGYAYVTTIHPITEPCTSID
jgi:hypothetical protein